MNAYNKFNYWLSRMSTMRYYSDMLHVQGILKQMFGAFFKEPCQNLQIRAKEQINRKYKRPEN
jgi:hypothetical protein